jgi:hypothetical protein
MTAALTDRADRRAVLQLFAESLDQPDAELLQQLLAKSRRHR